MMNLFRRARDTVAAYGLWIWAEFTARMRTYAGPANGTARAILFIAEKLPPYTKVGVYRPLSWIQRGCASGWDVAAISYPHHEPLSEAGRALRERVPPQLTQLPSPRRKLDPFIRLIPFMPTHLLSGLQMFRDGWKAIRHRPDVIVATGPNFDTFVAGYYLSRYFGSKLILDYRDEWSLHPVAGWGSDASARKWEERCLREADLVIHTTKRQMDHHLAHFPFMDPDRERVILNGCDPSELKESSVSSIERRSRSPLSILFAGTLNAMNGPELFFEDLEAVMAHELWHRKIRIDFVGDNWGFHDEEFARRASWPFLRRSPAVPKAEVANLIEKSDVLLLLVPPQMERYIPAKLFEYIASGKPILVHGYGGEIADIVRELNAGPLVPAGDPDALALALRELMDAPADRWQSEKRRRWAESHLRERSAERFYDELARIAS